jgi:hypothetical protein
VKLDARMAGEEFANQLGFVSGEIVEDDMNLLPTRAQRYDLFEEGDEVAAGVAGGGFSMHASGLGIQRGIERKRAMAIVLETVTFGASGRKWQNRVEPVQSLNRGFSSTQNTAACCGGRKYRPIMSAALRSKSGSSLAR